MNLPQAANVFMSQSLLVGGLSFEVHLPGFNQETELAIQEVKDIASDKAEAKTYHSVGELLRLFQSLCKLINTDIRCVNSFSVSWAFDPIQL